MRSKIAAVLLATALAPCLAWGAAAAGPLPDAVPAEVLAAPPAMIGPSLSPNGDKIAAKMAVAGKMTFVVTPVGSGQPYSLATGDKDILWWRWVNNDWLVLGLGDTVTAFNQDFYVTRIAGVSADLSKFQPIDWVRSGQFADDLVFVPRDGSTRILFAKQTGFMTEADLDLSVFEADVTTGKAKLAIGARGSVYDWRADANGTVRLGFGYDYSKRRMTMLYRDRDKTDFKTMSLDEKSEVPIPLAFRPNGTAITVDSATGFDEVYEMSLSDFKLGKKLFGVPGYDVDGIIRSHAGDDVIGAQITTTAQYDEWFDPKFKAVQSQLDQAVGKGNGEILSWDRSGDKMVVRVGDASQAGGIFFWEPNGGAPRLLGWNNSALQGRKLNPVKSIRYQARDGTPIEAVLTLPRGREAKKLPLIVLPHGGPAARDAESFDWWTQYLAEQGYAVIQPNYRGSVGYGAAFYEKGEGEWGLKMQDDLLDAIKWTAGQGIADDKRVCIAGASYGGYAAMRAAHRDAGHYRCAISFAGVSDLKAMLKYDRRYLLGEYAKKFWKAQTPDPAGVSPVAYAAQFGMPILIMHGAKDKRVPLKQSAALAEALQKAGKPHVYIAQPEGDHHFSRTQDKLQFLREMKAFLDKHNPA